MTEAVAILEKAAELVGGDRATTHGDKTTNHAAIAALWNGFLEARRILGHVEELSAEDVAKLMVLLKVARTLGGSYNRDDYVDMAGYAGVAADIRAALFV